ncbi:MAG TPA: amidase [Usitatibacter sp.]|nr:amidase [Usitatibacter sp.]
MPDAPNPARREFLAITTGAVASLGLGAMHARAQAASPPTAFALEEATLSSLAERMRSGELTSQAITAAYLERIEAVDRAGPKLRSVLETNPEALAIARALDEERKAGRVRGPLHGVPILLKDNIATGDRMTTTAGSLMMEGQRIALDAALVVRLRRAGAVMLGKTNLSEWANFRSSNSISGWSSRGGQTLNPYAPGRSPSGSSSGSAVAVAANLCAAAIGTETDGSIVSPSACNNIVGFKPTLGLVSRTGVIPIAHSQDTGGPMARSARDCALLMNAMFGFDARDAETLARGVPMEMDFTSQLGRKDLKDMKIGIGRQFMGVNEKVDAIMGRAMAQLRDLGAQLVDVEFRTYGKWGEAEAEVFQYEFKAGINAWLEEFAPNAPARSLAALIEFNDLHRDRIMPLFGQDLMIKAQGKGPLTDEAYVKALAQCRLLARTQGIDALVKSEHIDAIIAPTTSPPWMIDPVTGDSGRGGCASLPAVAGYPHLTVPAGFIKPGAPFQGLAPVGISFFGPAFSDAKLLAIGHVFENATRHRQAPVFA